MKTSRFALVVAACLALLATCLFCNARVFYRWGSGSDSDAAIEAAGGKKAYSTTLSVNGGNGSLSVFSFGSSIRDAVARISSLFKDASMNYDGGTMAFGLVNTGKLYLRFLVLQLEAKGDALVFKLEQSADEYEKSKKPPEKHLLEQVPEYPGSRPVFFAKNDDTSMGIGVAETESDPAAIRQFYNSSLAAQGWETPLKNTVDTDVYLKEQSICYVLITPSPTGNLNRITLLHKRYGMK